MHEDEQEVISEVADGGFHIISLNRQKKLNALNLDMIRQLARCANTLQGDPTAKLLLLKGNGERAFCAGGQLLHPRDLGVEKHLNQCFIR